MDKYADLHIHTNASDGILSPDHVVSYAHKINLAAIAIADHDSTEGIEPSLSAGKKYQIEVIPSIEISSDPLTGSAIELHFLGYCIDWQNQKLQDHLRNFRQARRERALEIVEKLKKVNVYLETEELLRIADTGSVGRLHVAKALVEQKIIYNIHEAFDKYLAPGKPAYVPKMKLSAQAAIELISQTRGIPVLAHPIFGVEFNIDYLKELKGYGLKGLEVYHPKHSKKAVQFFKEQAKDIGFLITGGSDCHGGLNGSDPQIGSIKIPYSLVEQLLNHKPIS